MSHTTDREYFTRKCLDDCAARERKIATPPMLGLCRSLDDYARFFGTDKSACFHGLCATYERFLAPLRKRRFTLVEFGVRDGASLNMWAAWLPRATVIGIDPNAASVTPVYDNVKILVMDAFDYPAVKAVMKESPPLVIVDDATHYWSHQINAFEEYFPCLLENGLCIVEDIETSYGDFRKGIWADQPLDAASYFLSLASAVAGVASCGVHPLTGAHRPSLIETIAAVTFIKDSVLVGKNPRCPRSC